MTIIIHAWPYGRFIEIYKATSGEKNFIEQIKPLIFFQTVLAIEIMYEPQPNLEEKVNPSILKGDFSSRTDQSTFKLVAPVLLDQSNKTNSVFLASKLTNHFLPQSSVSCRSDSSSEVNSSCCHRSDA